MTDKKISKDEQDLFRDAMQGVRPLKTPDNITNQQQRSSKTRTSGKTSKLRKIPISHHYDSSRTDTYSDHIREPVSGRAELFFARPGLQEKILRMLRRGKLPCQARLDLHGMTVAEARYVLNNFLRVCIHRRCQCVWIIHGKGDIESDTPPPLKNQVNNWLQQEANVLAFCSAQPRDGGTGSVYVLLKRQIIGTPPHSKF